MVREARLYFDKESEQGKHIVKHFLMHLPTIFGTLFGDKSWEEKLVFKEVSALEGSEWVVFCGFGNSLSLVSDADFAQVIKRMTDAVKQQKKVLMASYNDETEVRERCGEWGFGGFSFFEVKEPLDEDKIRKLLGEF